MPIDENSRVEKVGEITDLDSFLEMYDEVAVELLGDPTPDRGGFNRSCPQIAETVCQIMNWPDFDLFAPHDFEAAYKEAEPSKSLAYAMIAYLLGAVFRRAETMGLGNTPFNEEVATHAEFWHQKLTEQWVALRQGKTPSHKWIN
jgi:hypothetical protein